MKNTLVEFVQKYAPVSEEQAGVLAAICKKSLITSPFSRYANLLNSLDAQYPVTLIIDDAPQLETMRTLLDSGWGKYMSIIKMLKFRKDTNQIRFILDAMDVTAKSVL